jgi:hypothetical protein
MRITFIGKDPGSQEGHSPTLYATDRTDRQTFLVQGWVVTDPQALSELGDIPAGEAVIEAPVEVLRMVDRADEEGER